jgi:hypothetical protein
VARCSFCLTAGEAAPYAGVIAAPDFHEVCLMRGGGTRQLLREAAAADIGSQLDTMFVGICFSGTQPQTAGALPAFVFLPHLAEAGAIEVREGFFDSERDQPGTLHLGKADRLS